MNNIDAYVILPNLRVKNVNTISSPLTWGFPSLTAIFGFVHALERKLRERYHLKFKDIAVTCHYFEAEAYRPLPYSDYSFSLTRNPPRTKKQIRNFEKGQPPSFVEEGRAHMEITLVIQAAGEAWREQKELLETEIMEVASTLRLAGGSILSYSMPLVNDEFIVKCPDVLEDQEIMGRKILKKLLPGSILIDRKDLLKARTQELQEENSDSTALDALLEFSSLNYEYDAESEIAWTPRKKSGWLVPIPVGYQAISKLYEPGYVRGARDAVSPCCFVESIYSLGQWVSPHRFKQISDIFWSYDEKSEAGLYRLVNSPENFIRNFN
ncbi:type I-F CRISPR-associated protein Csy2 [Coxiella burnetii]|nr:type I-F CRISPR-associated protein Csy2 [Coxiella burnetii]